MDSQNFKFTILYFFVKIMKLFSTVSLISCISSEPVLYASASSGYNYFIIFFFLEFRYRKPNFREIMEEIWEENMELRMLYLTP